LNLGNEWSCHLTTWRATLIVGKDPVSHLTKSSVDSRNGLNIMEKRETFLASVRIRTAACPVP
jgi:hypothetical protein